MKSETPSFSEFPPCPNCGHQLHVVEKYCPSCGQKVRSAFIPLKLLFREFIETVLNLDSRFFKTIQYLFVPGFLTQEFFRGKDISYYRPLRLYFTTLVILYAVLGIGYLGKLEVNITSDTSSIDYFASKRALALVEKAKPTIGYDTLSRDQRAFVDTLSDALKFRASPYTLNMLADLSSDSVIQIPMEDIYELDLDSICRKYQITDFGDKVVSKQLIRLQKEPAKVIRSVIANTSWMLLLLVPALAFVMKLLYLRRARYYTEHLVFLCHYHAAVCVYLTLYLIAFGILPFGLRIVIPLLCPLFLLVAIKVYYRQGWVRTFLKYMALLVSYFLLLIIFVGITFLVSLLIYR